jgi:hypothetical protein
MLDQLRPVPVNECILLWRGLAARAVLFDELEHRGQRI